MISSDMPTAQIIGQIISSYGLESLQLDGTTLEGTGYITFRAVTPKGVFALRRKKGSAAKIMARHPEIGRSIEGQHRLMLFLHNKGFPVAPPLLTKENDTYVNILGIPWSLYPFIDGRPMEPTNLRQLRAAAEALARYHQLTAEYSGAPPLSQPLFPKLFQEKLNEFRKYSKALDSSPSMTSIDESVRAFNASLDEIEKEVWDLPYDFMPKVVIHGDYKPGNLLFQGDDVAAVIDFGRSRNEARLFDIAKTISGLIGTSDYETFLKMTTVIFDAYNRVYPLSDDETKALFSLIQARLAFKALDRLVGLAIKKDVAVNSERAERVNALLQHLSWLRNNSEIVCRSFQQSCISEATISRMMSERRLS